MTMEDIDLLPRLRDTHTADQLNTEGCLMLVEELCKLAAADYVATKNALKRSPSDKQAKHNYHVKRDFFLSEYFFNLTGLDGKAVLDGLDKDDGTSWGRKYTKSTEKE